jgi:signal transduction histidine kinase
VDALVAEQRLTPVLASLGIQMAEFVHEVNGLLAMATTVDTVLGQLREDPDNFASPEVRRRAAASHQAARDLRARLERQASYLIDLTSPTAVRRRSRQRLAERFDRATQLVAPAIERKRLRVTNRIPRDLRTPPMYPAEITAVLLNLLTNAVKAAAEGGRIAASGRERRKDKTLILRLDNTGQAVDLDDAERWFRPFETTTVEVDPLLGQGMGLGLPISRGIVEEYGGALAFVEPRSGFATAIEIQLPMA